jgi:hypothetical protein
MNTGPTNITSSPIRQGRDETLVILDDKKYIHTFIYTKTNTCDVTFLNNEIAANYQINRQVAVYTLLSTISYI